MDTTTTSQNPAPVAATEDKTVAIVSYITIFGFIAAIINSSKKTKLGAFHLRQMLGFILAGIGAYMCLFVIGVIPIVNFIDIIAIPVLGISVVIFWILGLVAAINGQMKPMPLIGSMFQKWFGTTFD